ncbi:MAG TPA: hypothetical protein VM597_27925 [Gemmataceae bacterium]|nr:hypothetical protein [Gemmataceae bacterium]
MSSASQQSSTDGDPIRRIRRQVEHAMEQLGALSGSALPPGEFYGELLRKGLDGIDAPAGAVWVKTPQGFLQQQCQQNLAKVGLDDHPDGRQAHNQLLRLIAEKGKPGVLGPRVRADIDKSAGNPTDYALALAPILSEDNQTLGLVEIFQKPNWHPQDLVTYCIQVAGYASNFLRNSSNRKVAGQEAVWTQLEVFSRQVHGSLNPTEVAYTVANEGRRLIGCDRISVGIRHGRKTTIEAVSGADVVEKASTHIRRMRDLFDAVIQWGEKLVYRGTRDETLPPKVLEALDAYLTEQNPKLLVLLPVRDEREKPKEGTKEVAKPVRSAVLMEVFDPPEQTALIEQKLDVVAAHSATALYNAAEMKRVPLKPLWWPLMRVQQGLGGKARFWTFFTIGALALLVAVLVFVPYPMKLDAKGKVVPLDRAYIFPPFDAKVDRFLVAKNSEVAPGAPVARMWRYEFYKEIKELQTDKASLDVQIDQLYRSVEGLSALDKANFQQNRRTLEIKRQGVSDKLRNYELSYNADLNNAGYFEVRAPSNRPSAATGSPLWKVVTQDLQDKVGNTFRPNEPLMRVGGVSGGWELVLKIPEKHAFQVNRAFKDAAMHDEGGDYLWVDVLPVSAPTPGNQGRGKLYFNDVTRAAEPNRDDQNESEPVLLANVRINTADIPKEYHIDERLLVTDAEFHAKIIGGDHSSGYSLFYGVWEFLYEKVIFYLF